ncbi:hypothetical protein QFZ37_000453 [Chryseobacterium ginsenosidimutans]|uniref:putative phage abortive infection protein n=1 Tax=Chryseobacterium ginsenosidimutans TaxID=687846 RepID=UPI00277F3E59|nr:putative phage abortive infection protein [Chryseobacterium ginsenosidimutans]MDQ0592084.1 hypothetical protein [Chryseobacterium ginsenosidimutans]
MNNKKWLTKNLWRFVSLSLIFIFIVIAITLLLGYNVNYEQRGTFGDMFGFANALFTGLSFVGLIVTILLQSQEIKNTKEEVEKQGKFIKLQQFENILFQRLALLNQIINDIETTSTTNPPNKPPVKTVYKGRAALVNLFNIIPTHIQGNQDNFDHAYKIFYKFNYIFGHYFRNIFLILKTIDEEEFTADYKRNYLIQKKYAEIIRSQLSEHELAILFYSSLHELGIKEFKPLIEKYHLFFYINNQYILEEMKDRYNESAFIES